MRVNRDTPNVPWAKLQHNEAGAVTEELSLLDHSDDVASVFHTMAKLPGLSRRLAASAGVQALEASTIERLAYLVFLHDCGKVNNGFQARRELSAPPVGHIAPLAALFGIRHEREIALKAVDALNSILLESWGASIVPLLDAVFSHHGKPWPRDGDGRSLAKHWQPKLGYDPIAELLALRSAADARFPLALTPSATDLPSSERFVHAFAGLVQLADWIGSSGWQRDRHVRTTGEWSAEVLREIGLDPSPWRNRMTESRLTFRSVFERDPYAHQSTSGDGSARLLILEAETGSGKTEAALWRFLQLFTRGDVDGLYFALPTRTAASQLYQRVIATVRKIWPTDGPATVMAVPGYVEDGLVGSLPNSSDPLDEAESGTRADSTWAAEHPKRYFSAMIGVGTIDQALLATLRVKHAHLRGSSLMRHLLVVDEVHASDPYMAKLLQQLLRDHIAAGGYAMLLSATLTSESRQALITEAVGGRARDAEQQSLTAAINTPYPLVSTEHAALPITERSVRTKAVSVSTLPCLDDPVQIATIALHAARQGAKVLVVRNTVSGAIAAQRAIESLEGSAERVVFRLGDKHTLHHGRFAREDRQLLDAQVERSLGRSRQSGGLIVVGTQTLEQSLDIDADFLITDLCPIDVLLQRIGRLHRHVDEIDGSTRRRPTAYRSAECAVVVPTDGLTEFVSPRRRSGGKERHGMGHTVRDGGIQGVYVDVTVLETTRRLVENYSEWSIPTMNRSLVESGLHSEAIDAVLATVPAEERESWLEHRMRVEGDELAQGASASGNVLRRDRDFMEQGVEDAARVMTRLGADSRLIRLPDGTIGPFGSRISQISFPGWMLRSYDESATVLATLPDADGAIAISIAAENFRYDAHGLHSLAPKK